MKTPNEFWLCLHELSRAYEAEGATAAERAESILMQFQKMPWIAQREVLDSFWPLVQHLPDLYQRVVERFADETAAEHRPLAADDGGDRPMTCR